MSAAGSLSNISNLISPHYLSICHGPEWSARQTGSCLENTHNAFGAARKGRAPITLQSQAGEMSVSSIRDTERECLNVMVGPKETI